MAQMDEMYAAGWDFANHTMAHTRLDQLEFAAQLEQIALARDWLVSSGYPRTADYLAFPYGEFAGTGPALEAAGVVAARTVQQSPVETATGRFNRHRHPAAIDLRADLTLEAAFAAVDAAVRFGQSLIFVAHRIVESEPRDWQWTRSDLEALVAYVADRRAAGALQVKTFRELALELQH